MLALLKLVPLKDWIYGAIIVALLAAFGVYTVHERHIGEQKIEAADARAAKAQAVKVQTTEHTAQESVNASVKTYQAAVAAPSLPAPRILCHGVQAGHSAVPGHAASAGSCSGWATPPLIQ